MYDFAGLRRIDLSLFAHLYEHLLVFYGRSEENKMIIKEKDVLNFIIDLGKKNYTLIRFLALFIIVAG